MNPDFIENYFTPGNYNIDQLIHNDFIKAVKVLDSTGNHMVAIKMILLNIDIMP